MSAHRTPSDMSQAGWVFNTPGNGDALSPSRISEEKLVIGTTAETNTCAEPARAGLLKILTVISVGAGGSRAITFSQPIDQQGTTVLTFTVARQTALLYSVADGSTASGFRWQAITLDNTNAGNALQGRVTTQMDVANNAAPANVPGLSANVQAGKSYRFKATLFTTVGATGGANVQLGGTATATAVVADITFTDYATPAVTGARVTALGSPASKAGVTAYEVDIEGVITVNAAGTFTVQFGQKVSNATNSSVLVGSYLELLPIP
jgi:hypothetical protein